MRTRVASTRVGVDAEVGLAGQVADGVIRLNERRTAIDLRVRQAVGAALKLQWWRDGGWGRRGAVTILREPGPYSTVVARRRLGAGGARSRFCANLAPIRFEEKTEALAMSHDTFSRNTRNQLKQVFDALRELMTPPDPPKRPIGFVTHEDKSKKAKS